LVFRILLDFLKKQQAYKPDSVSSKGCLSFI